MFVVAYGLIVFLSPEKERALYREHSGIQLFLWLIFVQKTKLCTCLGVQMFLSEIGQYLSRHAKPLISQPNTGFGGRHKTSQRHLVKILQQEVSLMGIVHYPALGALVAPVEVLFGFGFRVDDFIGHHPASHIHQHSPGFASHALHPVSEFGQVFKVGLQRPLAVYLDIDEASQGFNIETGWLRKRYYIFIGQHHGNETTPTANT